MPIKIIMCVKLNLQSLISFKIFTQINPIFRRQTLAQEFFLCIHQNGTLYAVISMT